MRTEILYLIIYLIFFAFIIRTLRNALYFVFLWQLKEYRLDRILAHLKSPQGKKLVLGPLTLVKWILLLIIIGSMVLKYQFFPFGFYAYLLFAFIWLFEACLNIKELIVRGWRAPQFTLRINIILGIAFIIIFNPLLYPDFLTVGIISLVFYGPFIDKALPLIITALVYVLNIPSLIYRKLMIMRAKEKVSKLKNLIVIGITGSYGKTSIKEFLATILSEKYKVAKTPGFNNTEIGVARYVLEELKPFHEIFVVEMGAYKRGEIKAICDIVKPKIGIITAINQQHLELFGSIKNTQKTKYELIESLPKEGIAIFNGCNKYCLEMAKWTNTRGLKIFTYNLLTDVKNIRVFQDHLEFTWIDNNESCLLRVNLLGKQTIENVLAAVYVAKSLRMTADDIQKAVLKIIPPVKTMQFAGMFNGMTLVDDTFNANPDGVMAGVEYMKIFKGEKILVLTPLIELGDDSEIIHNNLGEKIADICDLIYLTNPNNHKSFVAGAKKAGGERKVRIVNTLDGTKLLKENMNKDGVVVFEGKEAGRILQQLTNNNDF